MYRREWQDDGEDQQTSREVDGIGLFFTGGFFVQPRKCTPIRSKQVDVVRKYFRT
jgi:hypothetical protein